MADDFTIRSTFCECRERVCCHVGALALHSGFNTPIFSYLPETETTTFAHGDTVKNPADEMCNRNEIEFVKVEQIENDQDESTTLDADDDSEIEVIMSFLWFCVIFYPENNFNFRFQGTCSHRANLC